MPRINKILVPTDFSASSREAVDVAVELSVRLAAPITLLHAYGLPAYPLPEGVLLATPEQTAQIISASSHALHGELARARASGATGIDSELVEGDPYDVIERIARERSADLIVMGTHGRRGLAHLLLGSVTEKLIQRGPCPVLAVRAAT